MSLGCQKGHQRHPYPPSPELDPWRTGGSCPLSGFRLRPGDDTFQISGMQDVLIVIKDTIHYLQSQILGRPTHVLDMGYVLEMTCFNFQVSRMVR